MDRDEKNRRRRELNRKLRGTKAKPKRDLVSQGTLDLLEAFWPRVVKDGDLGCWWWIGGYQSPDYGNRTPMFWTSHSRSFKAKSVAWAHLNGMSKQGYVPHLRSKCRNPCCVNPTHHRVGDDFPFRVKKSLAERLLIDTERGNATAEEVSYETDMPKRKVKRMLNEMQYGRECMDRVYAMRAERKLDEEKAEG